MFKIGKIIMQALVLALAVMSNSLYADSYKIIDIRNCAPTEGSNKLKIGDEILDKADIKPNPTDESKPWSIKLQSLSTGKIHPMCSKSSINNKSMRSESWIDWFWNSVIGSRKCSTRAPENELMDGIAKNLSQTFYLYFPYDDDVNSNVDFVTNLKDGTSLKCSYFWENKLYKFEMPILNGMFSLSSKYFDIRSTDERTALQIDVKYVTDDGSFIPITDSMNVILINE